METGPENSVRPFFARHAVLLFYVLVLALVLLLGVLVNAFLGVTGTGTAPSTPADLSPAMYGVAVLAGPASYTLAAVLTTTLAFGAAGLRDLGARLIRWRVGVRWYAAALLTAPVLMTTTLLALSLTSNAFLPGIITPEDRASLLVAGLVAGLLAGFFEEIAWTGFAAHEIGRRHGVLVTGLLVALPWFVLHLPLWVPADTGTVPRALSVAAIVPWFLAYRVLMVWVYTHTRSVLLAILMHVPITASGFILASPAMVGVPDVVYNLILGAALWILVAAATAADRRTPAARRGPDRSGVPLEGGGPRRGTREP
ncbi:CAAX prenyl protease-like protein [Georgenia soli]|uniref:CAAX prenyl protease-like protein n=2 Tax=Georgenia soli TaxID=638953 RepID=A0A2A9EKZ3_9MICO|nr:CAAX prenyl protease-like protein [Georgenia soli]